VQEHKAGTEEFTENNESVSAARKNTELIPEEKIALNA
jgi:hypothetical protein